MRAQPIDKLIQEVYIIFITLKLLTFWNTERNSQMKYSIRFRKEQ